MFHLVTHARLGTKINAQGGTFLKPNLHNETGTWQFVSCILGRVGDKWIISHRDEIDAAPVAFYAVQIRAELSYFNPCVGCSWD